MTHFIHAHTLGTHSHTQGTHTLTHKAHTLARMYFCSHILGMQATVWLNVALRPPLPPVLLLLPLPLVLLLPSLSLLQLPVSPYAAILLLVFHLTEANFGITTHFFTFASLTSKQIIIVVIIESSRERKKESERE